MASGSFKTNVVTAAGSGYYRQIEVVWSSTNNPSAGSAGGTSTVSWTAYSRATDSNNTARYVNAWNITVKINGVSTNINGSTTKKLYKDTVIGSGSVTVQHGTDGRKNNVDVAISASIWDSSKTNATYSGTINMDPNPVYNLTITPGSNSTITVTRISSGGAGAIGEISSGTKNLYYGDTLRITASSASNYQLQSLTVNGTAFTSGNTHTVSGNVSVVSAAQALASVISATPSVVALGNTLSISITKYNESYVHSIGWSFGGHTGYITSSGGTQSGEVKFSNKNVSFTVPTTWGDYIPNDTSGVCTLTCKTYASGTSTTQLGTATTYSFTVSAVDGPLISTATVADTNDTTLALTGDSSRLVKYMSTALCTLSASARNGASISSASINGTSVTLSGTPPTGTRTIAGVTDTSYTFTVTDTRGFSANRVVSTSTNPGITMVDYVRLTCIPTVARVSATSSSVTMKISGAFYNGAFDAAGSNVNTLKLSYMYKAASSSTWPSSWTAINSNQISYSGNAYSTASISLSDTFSYQEAYNFRIKAEDGIGNNVLTYVMKDIVLSVGMPIFDWGKNTFNFNVPITFENQQQSKPYAIVFRNDLDTTGVANPHSVLIVGGGPDRSEALVIQDSNKTTTESGSSVYYWPFAYEDANNDVLLYAASNARARSFVADFPNEVKYDATTGLYYRTWFSGTAEVWGQVTLKVPGVAQTGSLYYTEPYVTFSIPVTLTGDSTQNSVQITGRDAMSWAANATVNGSLVSMRWMRAVSMSAGDTYRFYVNIVGKTANYTDRVYGGGQ